jgi:hypothetical protein
VDPKSLEFWEWFYEPVNRGGEMSAEERRRAVEERWHPDLVLIQSPEMPGTAGEFHGYDGLAENTRELLESWDVVRFRPDTCMWWATIAIWFCSRRVGEVAAAAWRWMETESATW